MTIGKTINQHNKDCTPYIGRLVNHLPMSQLAIYNMTKDVKKVNSFTKDFLERTNIDKIRYVYPAINAIEDAKGNRGLYEPCLDIVSGELDRENLDNYVNDILNKYIFGLSSGLFHTSIRLAYAIEGNRIDMSLISEVERALAYYITAYRESKIFTRKIQGSKIKEEMKKLSNSAFVKEQLQGKESLGKMIRNMYEEEAFMDSGFIIKGDSEDKVGALLDLLIPAYYFSGNIVTLHCITGLHAIIVLKDYFDDYSLALDILTTSIIVHLLTIGPIDYDVEMEDFDHISWDVILKVAPEKQDVHAIKLAYTCHELYKLYDNKGLSGIAIKRIRSSQ